MEAEGLPLTLLNKLGEDVALTNFLTLLDFRLCEVTTKPELFFSSCNWLILGPSFDFVVRGRADKPLLKLLILSSISFLLFKAFSLLKL